MKNIKGLLAVALSLVAAGSQAAIGIHGEPVFARNIFAETAIDLRLPQNAVINKIRPDGANNMYLATDGGGITAVTIVGDEIERISTDFPLNNTRYPGEHLLSDQISSITFAPVDGKEHFFYSSDDFATGGAGVQWARYSDRIQFEERLKLLKNVSDDIAQDVIVNDLVYQPDVAAVYAGSEEGLLEIGIIPGENPQVSGLSPYTIVDDNNRRDLNNVYRVADATNFNGGTPAIAFITRESPSEDDAGEFFYLFEPGAADPITAVNRSFTNAKIAAIKEVGNDIYVVQKGIDTTASIPDTVRRIVKYTDNGGIISKTIVAEFNPDQGYYDDNNFLITDFAVDPVDGTIWLATTGRAFYQVPNGGVFDSRVCEPGEWTDPADDFYEANGSSCAAVGAGWRPIFKESVTVEGVPNNTPQQYRSLELDAGGNVWIGSNLGLRGFISRYMSLDSTRYIGINRRATVTLDDVDQGANPLFRVTVGGVSAEFPAGVDIEGRASLVFGFTFDQSADPGADPTPDPILFPVTSTPDGVEISVEYVIDGNVVLSAFASWAEIVPFEDDLFIGGPCFLETLFCGE